VQIDLERTALMELSFHLVFAIWAQYVYSIVLPLHYNRDVQSYYATVTIGTQNLSLLVDTGAPQTWLATNETKCQDPFGASGFTRCSTIVGTPYVHGRSYQPYDGFDNETSLQYADGSTVEGYRGFDDVRLNGHAVTGVPLISALELNMLPIWPACGIMGLSPRLPDNFLGSKFNTIRAQTPSVVVDSRPRFALPDDQPQAGPSDTLLDTIFNQTDLSPYFGLALSRAGNHSARSHQAGVLTIGESAALSSSKINVTAPYVSVPLEPYLISSGFGQEETYAYLDYSVNVSALLISHGDDDPDVYFFGDDETTTIIDSGTSVNYIPEIHAAYVAALFKPPGRRYAELFFVNCDAEAPEIGLGIGAQPFFMNPKDMILEVELVNRTTACLSAFQYAPGFSLLGQPFLRNVYTEVYREEYNGPEAATMWVASRPYYQST
jgi:hypothetical protein